MFPDDRHGLSRRSSAGRGHLMVPLERATGLEPATLTLARECRVPLETAATAGVEVSDARLPLESAGTARIRSIGVADRVAEALPYRTGCCRASAEGPRTCGDAIRAAMCARMPGCASVVLARCSVLRAWCVLRAFCEVMRAGLVDSSGTLRRVGFVAVGLLAIVGVGCSNDRGAADPASAPRGGTGDRAAGGECRVTSPGRTADPPEEVVRWAGFSHGLYDHDNLWVALPDPSARLVRHADGGYGQKFMWWRGAESDLVLDAHRVGDIESSAETEVPDGYGSRGFQASGVTFPTEGCWRVTGQLGNDVMAFVVVVP